MFDPNKKHLFIQDLQSIGLVFVKEIEADKSTTMVFDHRGKQVLIDAELVSGEITKFSNLSVDGKAINLQYDFTGITEAEFKLNLGLYVSQLNKEIMKLDNIDIPNAESVATISFEKMELTQ